MRLDLRSDLCTKKELLSMTDHKTELFLSLQKFMQIRSQNNELLVHLSKLNIIHKCTKMA